MDLFGQSSGGTSSKSAIRYRRSRFDLGVHALLVFFKVLVEQFRELFRAGVVSRLVGPRFARLEKFRGYTGTFRDNVKSCPTMQGMRVFWMNSIG
jgi:hypothetical protein